MNKLLKLVKLIDGNICHTFNDKEDYHEIVVNVKTEHDLYAQAKASKFNGSYSIERVIEEFTDSLERLIYDGKYHDDRFITAVLNGKFYGWDVNPNPSKEDIEKGIQYIKEFGG